MQPHTSSLMTPKTHIAIIGCGIIGALTAYELSQDSRFRITVLNRQHPGQGSTGAALGVLMGVISHKKKGRRWHRCWAGLERYETLVPELEAITGQSIPFNQNGLLRLCFEGDDMAGWQRLAEVRAKQELPLEVLSPAELAKRYPQVQSDDVIGAVYSARDRQVHPQALVQALVQAAQLRGVQFRFDADISHFTSTTTDNSSHHCQTIHWGDQSLEANQIILTAGLGSSPLAQKLQLAPKSAQAPEAEPSRSLDIRPVLGQALHISLPQPLSPKPQPVINGQDLHIAPIGSDCFASFRRNRPNEYWIGATVELPDDAGNPPELEQARLDALWQTAISFCPALAEAKILRSWSGLRPRPEGRPAPILEPLTGYNNVLLATGHYRNGVLLAPASAQWVQAELTARLSAQQ